MSVSCVVRSIRRIYVQSHRIIDAVPLANLLDISSYDTVDTLLSKISSKLYDLDRNTGTILYTLHPRNHDWAGIARTLNISYDQPIGNVIASCIFRIITCPTSRQTVYVQHYTGLPPVMYDRSVHTVSISRSTSYTWYIRGIDLTGICDAKYLYDSNVWMVCGNWHDRFTTWFESLNRVKSLFHCAATKIISMKLPYATIMDSVSQSNATRLLHYNVRDFTMP